MLRYKSKLNPFFTVCRSPGKKKFFHCYNHMCFVHNLKGNSGKYESGAFQNNSHIEMKTTVVNSLDVTHTIRPSRGRPQRNVFFISHIYEEGNLSYWHLDDWGQFWNWNPYCTSHGSPEKQNPGNILTYIYSPKASRLQTEEQKFQSNGRLEKVCVPAYRQEEFPSSPPFCSIQDFNWLDEAHSP